MALVDKDVFGPSLDAVTETEAEIHEGSLEDVKLVLASNLRLAILTLSTAIEQGRLDIAEYLLAHFEYILTGDAAYAGVCLGVDRRDAEQ